MLSKKQLVAIYDYIKLARFDAEHRAGDANNLKMPLFRAEILAEAKRRAKELRSLERALEAEIGEEIDEGEGGKDEWRESPSDEKNSPAQPKKRGGGKSRKPGAGTLGSKSKGSKRKTSGAKQKSDISE
jgi:hypothetical protein